MLLKEHTDLGPYPYLRRMNPISNLRRIKAAVP
jgi:hypothetical protein